DRYDGTAWTASGTYRPTASELPRALAPSAKGPKNRFGVSVLRPLPWSYVPTGEGQPLHVSGLARLAMDPETGVIIHADPLRDGNRYTVETETVTPPAADQVDRI